MNNTTTTLTQTRHSVISRSSSDNDNDDENDDDGQRQSKDHRKLDMDDDIPMDTGISFLDQIVQQDHQRSLRIEAVLNKKNIQSVPTPICSQSSYSCSQDDLVCTRNEDQDLSSSTLSTLSSSSLEKDSSVVPSTTSSSVTASLAKNDNKNRNTPETSRQRIRKRLKASRQWYKKKGKKKMPRGTDDSKTSSSNLAFDPSLYTQKDLIKALKQSRSICDQMELREERRIQEIAERLFHSDDDDDDDDDD